MKTRHCKICGKDNNGELNNSQKVCGTCLLIQKQCGCGYCSDLIFRYGKSGRENKYVIGHHLLGKKRIDVSANLKGKKRLFFLGTNHPFYGKKRPEHSKAMSSRGNPMYGRTKDIDPERGKKITRTAIERGSYRGDKNGMFGRQHRPCSIEKMRLQRIGKHPSPEALEKNKATYRTLEAKDGARKRMIEMLKRGIFSIKPNGPEKELIGYLRATQPHEWKYTGDGSFWVGGLNPDFVNEKTKQIIEHFGCYWHGCPSCFPNHKVKEMGTTEYRVAKYAECGWDCLVVWEHDIRNGNYKELFGRFLTTGQAGMLSREVPMPTN